MDTQQAYEKIRAWFTRPNAQFGWEPGSQVCVYRGNEKAHSRCRCALGVLIESKDYNPIMEQYAARILAERIPYLQEVELSFLVDAQRTHDSCAAEAWDYENGKPKDSVDDYIKDFISDLDGVAAGFGLTVVV